VCTCVVKLIHSIVSGVNVFLLGIFVTAAKTKAVKDEPLSGVKEVILCLIC